MPPEEKKPRKKSESGGFKVKQETRKPIEEVVEEELQTSETEVAEEVPAVSSEVEVMVGEMLVEASAKMIGRTTALLTKIPEMDFDEEELEQLKAVWSPLMPSVSPVFAAIVVTLTIVSGKVVIYRSLKKRVQVEEEKGEFEKMGPEKSAE